MKCASGSMDRASDSGSEGWGFESLLAYQMGVLIGLPFELFVNIFQKLHVGVQLFSVLKLWIEGLFPYYNIRRFLRQRKTTITVQVKLSCVTSSQGKGKFR